MADSTPELYGVRTHLSKVISFGSGRIFAQVLNLILVPVILIKISPADYSTITLLQVIALIIGVLMSFDISTIFMAKFRDEQKKEGGLSKLLGLCLSEQTILGGAVLLIGIAFAPLITKAFAGDQASYLLVILFISKYFANHTLIFARWQILTGKHWQVSACAVIRSVVYLFFSISLIFIFDLGILGLAVSDALAELCTLIACLIFSKSQFPYNFQPIQMRDILALGLPAMPSTVFFWLIVSLPVFFLRQAGQEAAAGYFSLAWRIASPLDVLSNSLASGAARVFISSSETNSTRNVTRIYRYSVALLALSVIGIVLFGREIISIFFSEDFAPTSALIPYIAAGYYFLGLYYFEWLGISGSNKTVGLSVATGAGMLSGLFFFLLVGANINEVFSSFGFAISFAAMWIFARLSNQANRFGFELSFFTFSILLISIPIITTGSAVQWINSLAGKLFILSMSLILFGIYELVARAKEIKFDDQQINPIIQIPTYRWAYQSIDRAKRILDIGGAEGGFLNEIDAPVRFLVDMDINCLLRGKKSGKNVQFVCADATALPFPQESFDQLVMIGLLPYVRDYFTALREASRVTGSGGKILITATRDYPLYKWINIHAWKHPIQYFQKNQITDLLANNEFSIEYEVEKGFIIAPALSFVYLAANKLDRHWNKTSSWLGPAGMLVRRVTNPLIQWEFDHIKHPGYQTHIIAIKK